MAYGQAMLRLAGQKLKNFDKAYAARAAADMAADDPRIAQYATPLNKIMGGDAARYQAEVRAQPGGWMGGDVATEVVSPWSTARTPAAPVVVPEDIGATRHTINDLLQLGGNIGVRYGLPAAGVTFAGKGLYDLTAAFGNGGDYPSEGTLPL